VYTFVERIAEVVHSGATTAGVEVTDGKRPVSVGQIVIVTAFFLVTVVSPCGSFLALTFAGAATSQVRRSNATVPRIETKWLAMYVQSSGMASPESTVESSQTPVAAPNSVIWPSFKKAVMMSGKT
jgi:hypothetical protein